MIQGLENSPAQPAGGTNDENTPSTQERQRSLPLPTVPLFKKL